MLVPQSKLSFLRECQWVDFKTASKRALTNLGQSQLQLKINTGLVTCYTEGSIIKFVLRFLHYRSPVKHIEVDEILKLEHALRGCIVEVKCGGYYRRYKVASLSRESCDELLFELNGESGQFITVSQYYKNKGKSLIFPTFPAIIVEGPRVIYLPMEICNIRPDQHYPNQHFRPQKKWISMPRWLSDKRNNDKHMNSDVRMQSILQAKGKNINNFLSMAVGEQIGVEARIIPPPTIQYDEIENEKEGIVKIADGTWNINNMVLHEASKVHKLGIVNYSHHSTEMVNAFYTRLIGASTLLGMVLQPLPLILEKVEDFREQKMQLLVVILPLATQRTRNTEYGHLKAICDHDLCCPSQFVQAESVLKYFEDLGFLQRLCLQINAKLGACNHLLVDPKLPLDKDACRCHSSK